MWKNILGTVGARYLVALLNLLLIFVNAKVLGAEGLGLVGILIASINLVTTFNSIFCGGTIVYFMHRYSLRDVFIPAYLWAIFGSMLATAVLALAGMFPLGYLLDVYLLSLTGSLITANSRFLLGQDRVGAFNLIFMIQGGLLCPVLLFLYFILGLKDAEAYLYGLYVANLSALGCSLWWLYRDLRFCLLQTSRTSLHWREMLVYGLWGNVDNLAEVCTTRINYFFIRRFLGFAGVGLLDGGTRISESVWHINRSIGFIEYSRVARTNDVNEQKQLTLRFFKLTFGAVTLAICGILLLPEWIYTDYLFSAEFVGMRKVIVGLSVGIVALACNSILSQYFVGTGRVRWSVGCSFLGLFSLLISGYWLMPLYGVVGAAVSCSIAYCSMLTFSLIVFCRVSGTHWTEFRITKSDIRFTLSKIRKQT